MPPDPCSSSLSVPRGFTSKKSPAIPSRSRSRPSFIIALLYSTRLKLLLSSLSRPLSDWNFDDEAQNANSYDD